MARTKAGARKGAAGHVYRENAKTPEGRKLNQELKKNKRDRPSLDEKELTNVDANGSSDARPLKKAKTAGEHHVSQRDSSNTTTSTDKQQDTQSPTKPKNSKSQSNTTSEFAPPLYGDIANTHDITHISVLTSTKIQTKVKLVLEKLAQYPAIHPAKPAVIFIHSKAVAASKMITIVEIAKRDIASGGGKWFQYNTTHRVMEEMPRDEAKGNVGKKEAHGAGGERSGADKSNDADGVENEEGEGQEEESFEVMKTPFERAIKGTPKVRAVAILGTYLSRVRIEGGLAKRYGEQTNALEAKEKSDSS